MGSMKKWMLAIALAVGTLGLGASQANAARVGIYVGGQAYVPACPGPGYSWVAGYYNNGYWVPGFWRAPEPRFGVAVRGGYGWHGPVYDHRMDDHRFYRGGFRR